MAKESPKVDAWMPLWIGAYLADTMHLTRDQHGGYLLLLFAYWRNKGPLVDDDEELAAIAKASPAEWKKLGPRLARFFDIDSGYWSHKRADDELTKAGIRRTAAVNKAKAAAEARWGKDREQSTSNAPSMPGASPQALQEDLLDECPTPSPSPTSLRSVKKSSGYPAEFETAWTAYPKRPGASKADSLKAWNARVNAGADPAAMLAGVQRYAAFCIASSTAPNFIKQPATFFGPGEHYLSDWTPSTAPLGGGTIHDRRAATHAGLTRRANHANSDSRTIDAEAHVVG